MKNKRNTSSQAAFAKLRARAEQVLNSENFENANLEEKDVKALFQELQVHQIELEMQNDELRIANLELEMQQMKLSGMYDLAPIGYFILNRSGIIEEVNNAGIALLHSAKAGVKLKKLQVFVTDDSYDTYYHFFHEMLVTGTQQSCQLQFINKAGAMFYAQVEGIAIKNSSQCYIAIVDVTERMRAEQNLSEIKERLELALAASAAGTWELDVETMHFNLDVANYRLCNVTEGKFDGKYQSFIELIHPDDQFMADQHFRTAVNYNREIDLVCRFKSAEEQVCFASIRGHMQAKQDNNKCFIGIMMDITEKKRMEEEAALLKAQQQRNITTATLNAEENERKRISEALHDSVSQLLYGIKIQLNYLNNPQTPSAAYNRIKELLNVAIQETRNISFELAPSILADFGLPATIEELAKRLSAPGLQIQTVILGLNQRLDLLLETSIYRIVQELVNNSLKHSGADSIYIEIKKNKHIEIVVKDNGKGFNVKEQERTPKGAGLSSIKNRLTLYNGVLHISSSLQAGTVVKIKLFI